jgi:hypothetical protein
VRRSSSAKPLPAGPDISASRLRWRLDRTRYHSLEDVRQYDEEPDDDD